MAATTAPPAPLPVTGSVRPAQVSTALAWREARFVVRHPLVLFGVIASAWVLWSINREQLPHLGGFSTYIGMGLAPLAGAALLMGHLTASRAQRHQTIEIESTAPAMQRSRTIAHLAGTLAVVPIAAILAVAYMVYLYVLGGTGQPDIGELLVGPMVVGLGAVVGVAAGTWFRNASSGLLALGVLAGVQIALQDADGTRHWFAWWHSVLWHTNPDLWIRPTWAHVGYVAGVAVAVAAVAVLRHGLRPLPLLALGVAAVAVVAGGAVQAQPPSDADVAAAFRRVAEPADSWVTVGHDTAVYRVHPSYERWVDWWDPIVQATMAPIPAAARPSLVFELWHHPYLGQLEEEYGYFTEEGEAIQKRGEEASIATAFFERRDVDRWPIRMGTTAYFQQRDALATGVAQRAVGLPLAAVEMEGRLYTDEELAQFDRSTVVVIEEGGVEEIIETGEPWWPGKEFGDPKPVAGDRIPLQLACSAEGQAREVIAAWLAAQASPALADLYRDIRADGPRYGADGSFGGVIYEYEAPGAGPLGEGAMSSVNWRSLRWIRSDAYGGSNGSEAVLGSPAATDLAAQLLELNHDEVAAAITANWDQWTNPATSTQALIDHFGLEAPPTPEEWLTRAGLDPIEYATAIAAYGHWIGAVDMSDQPYPTCP